MSVWDDLVESCKDAVGRDVNDLNDVADVVDELNREVCRLNKERMYSEEVVLKLLEEYEYDLTLADNLFEGTPKQWLEQFKKR